MTFGFTADILLNSRKMLFIQLRTERLLLQIRFVVGRLRLRSIWRENRRLYIHISRIALRCTVRFESIFEYI